MGLPLTLELRVGEAVAHAVTLSVPVTDWVCDTVAVVLWLRVGVRVPEMDTVGV